MNESITKQHACDCYRAILTTLTHEWDPIGVSDIVEAQDEYCVYAEGVCEIIALPHTKESDVFAYLRWVETEYIGLQGNIKLTRAIAKKLYSLKENN